LQSNIWYHLGLAHYLKGDFKAALKAYREGAKVSTNPDMLVATTHWQYMTLRRLGREKEAAGVVAVIKPDLEVIENADYLKLIRLYQGNTTAEELLKQFGGEASALSQASIGYGLGNWFLYNKQRDEAEKIFRQVILGNQWASFGHIAAEVELSR
jgi:tetratricopeptide (TPR) repeat protein